MKSRQLSFLPPLRTKHGGTISKGKRKLSRPIIAKQPLHIVLRATKARGEWSFLHKNHKGYIHLHLIEVAQRFGIKVYSYANVGNHLHIAIKGRSRKGIVAFLKVFPQKVMFQVTGARKGNAQGRFFDTIAYTRVVSWGKDLQQLISYIAKNTMEALGVWKDADWISVPS